MLQSRERSYHILRPAADAVAQGALLDGLAVPRAGSARRSSLATGAIGIIGLESMHPGARIQGVG